MNRISKINYKIIQMISASQFYSMKNCAYKFVLAEAMNKKPLLPVSANAYYGKVLHKMLELISIGNIRNEDDFSSIFQCQIKIKEEDLIKAGYDFFVPLQKNVKDFIMKKILLKDHLRNISEKPPKLNYTKLSPEKCFKSNDKLIAGQIDLVIETDQKIEIIDFKTGSIAQDVLDDDGEIFSDVKIEYKDQLKLYAYLYFENTGKFPTQLSLIDLAKQKFTIDFTESECKILFEEAKELLKSTNETISSEKFVANPSEANCKYCLYRPACSFFLKYLDTNYSFNDVSGSIKEVVKYLNGNVSVFLENKERKVRIASFPEEKYEELSSWVGKKINVFNLRKESSENLFSVTKTTMIYANNNSV